MADIDATVGSITSAARNAVEALADQYAAELEAEKARAAAELAALRAEFDAHMATHEPDPEPTALKRIGMSAPENQWTQRLREVGPGVTARRIFVADLADGREKAAVIQATHDAGLLPVVSYKALGATSAWAEKAATFLASFNKPTLVAFNHEPHGDMTPAEYVALQRRLTPVFKRGQLRVGPILNGWLLDRRRADFESYLSDDLLDLWDFVGMDVYQSGSETNPGDTYPGHRIKPLLEVLADRGHPDKPVVIGEWNGWTAAALRESGETFLSTPNVTVALVFNSDNGNKGRILTGDRLAAFQATLADSRVRK